MSKLFFEEFLRPNKLQRTTEDMNTTDRRDSQIIRQKQLQDFKQKNLQLVEQLSLLEIHNSNIQYELDVLKVRLETANAKGQTLQQQQMFNQINLESELKSQLQQLNSQLISKERQLQECQLSRERDNQQLLNQQNQILNQQRDIQQLQDQLTNSKKSFDHMDNAKQLQLEDINKNTQSELNNYKQKNNQLVDQIKQLIEDNSQFNVKYKKIMHKLEQKSQQLIQQQQNNEQLKEECLKLTDNQQLFDKTIKTLKIEKKILNDSNSCLKGKINHLEQQIEILQQQMQEKISIIQQLENIAFGLKQSAEEGKENTNQTLQQYHQLMQECDQLEQQIHRLELDNDMMKKSYELMEQENIEYHNEIQILNQELIQVQNQNTSLNQDNHSLSIEITTLNVKIQELQQYALGFQRELKDHIEQQNQINKQRSLQNSQHIQRNSYNSINKNTDSSMNNQSPMSTITNTANQLKKIIKKQCVEGCSSENTKRHQQRTDMTGSKINTDRHQSEEMSNNNNEFKENSLQQLQDKYYALRNRIYDQKK